MESIAVAVCGPVLHALSSRDNELNKRAFQRALMKTTTSSMNTTDIMFNHLQYKLSEEISTDQMMNERKCREHVLQMQHEINCDCPPQRCK